MHLPDPRLPPLFTGHAVKAPATAFDTACRRAAAGDLGAADMVWSRGTERAAVALVLEPEVSLSRSCQMAALGLVAVAETLGHLCPPQVSVEFRWPSTVLVNGAAAGVVRLGSPADTALDAVPPWLVLGCEVQVRHPGTGVEPGERPTETCLAEEGAGDLSRTDVVEALAPRLLAWLSTWQDDGFRPIHEQWRFRVVGRDSETTIDGRSVRIVGLDDEGGLLVRAGDGAVSVVPYLAHVERVA